MMVTVIKAVKPIKPPIANNSAVTFDFVTIVLIEVIIKIVCIIKDIFNGSSLFFFSKKIHSLLKMSLVPLSLRVQIQQKIAINMIKIKPTQLMIVLMSSYGFDAPCNVVMIVITIRISNTMFYCLFIS